MLTLAEAAVQLGLSPSTLRNQVKAGKLRARLLGKTWTVTEREVERYRFVSLGRRRKVRPKPLQCPICNAFLRRGAERCTRCHSVFDFSE